MNCDKVGSLIFALRKEKGLTQKQLADFMNISDRTISNGNAASAARMSLFFPNSALLGSQH